MLNPAANLSEDALRTSLAELHTAQFQVPRIESANSSASWRNLAGTVHRLKATHR